MFQNVLREPFVSNVSQKFVTMNKQKLLSQQVSNDYPSCKFRPSWLAQLKEVVGGDRESETWPGVVIRKDARAVSKMGDRAKQQSKGQVGRLTLASGRTRRHLTCSGATRRSKARFVASADRLGSLDSASPTNKPALKLLAPNLLCLDTSRSTAVNQTLVSCDDKVQASVESPSPDPY